MKHFSLTLLLMTCVCFVFAQPSLTCVLQGLNANSTSVINAIPNRFNFSYDGGNTNISDGGSDMYDGGNYLNTNYASNMNYSDNLIVNNGNFGSNSSYFTRHFSGLFVMAADMNNVTYFEITGNNGADGSGLYDGTVLNITVGGITYNCFVKRVYNAGDPSINHVMIIPQNGAASHSYATTTDNDQHRLTGINASTRIYYLLYSATSGGYIDNNATTTIVTNFLNAISVTLTAPASVPGAPLCAGSTFSLSTGPSCGSLSPGNQYSVQLSDASGSFSTPVTIGTASSTGNTSINCTIPPNAQSGTGYRVRVISSSPVFTSAQTNAFTINTKENVPSAPNVTICNPGSALVTVPGGVGNHTWWDALTSGNQLGSGTSLSIPNINGTTTVYVQKEGSPGLSCASDRDPVTISITDLAVISSVTNTISCNAGSDGEIQLQGVNGAGNYTYSIDGINYFVSPVFSGLPSGSYTGYVQDGLGCIRTGANPEVLSDPAMLSGSLQQIQQVSCNNGSDGEIQLSGSGGTGQIQYSIDNINFQASPNFPGLASGSYTGYLQDAEGCLYTIPNGITLSNPASIQGSGTVSQTIDCFGSSTGEITLNGSGGSGILEYSLDGINYAQGNIFSGLPASSYTGYVRDSAGCIHTIPNGIVLSDPAAITGSAQITQGIDCNGNSTGEITVTASGGTGQLQYAVNGGNYQASGVFTALGQGNYTFTVQDNNNCVLNVSGPVVLGQPTAIQVSGQAVQQVQCNGGSNGILYINASGGTPGYQYSLTGSNYNALPVFSGLTAGNYTLYVQDNNGCVSTGGPLTLTQPSALTANAQVTSPVLCSGNTNGQIQVTGGGGNPGYSYSLNGNAPVPSGTFSNLSGGNYTIVITDQTGCSVSTSVTLANPTPVNSSVQLLSPVVCHNDNNGQIQVNASGGTPNYTYSLNGGAPTTNSTFSNLGGGIYNLVITDNNGCSTNNSITLNNPPVISGSAFASSAISCSGSDGEISVSASGGNGSFTYSIDGVNFQSSPVFTGLGPNTYNVVVKDANGCTYVIPSGVVLSAPSPVVADTVLVVEIGSNVFTADVFAQGGSGNYTYQLDGGNPQTSNHFMGINSGVHTFIITDDNNCSDTITVNFVPQFGTEENNVISIVCFPNPVTDVVNIQIEGTGSDTWNIRLVDALGRTVYMSTSEIVTNSTHTISTADLRPGMYMAYVSNGKEEQLFKLVK